MNTPFKDMHGNDVTVGSKIKIISTYSHQEENQIAEVIWDEKKGMYKYYYTEERRGSTFTSTDDFYGIHEFELIKQ